MAAKRKKKSIPKTPLGERVKDTINPLRKVARANMRTGTKISIINLVIVFILVIFLNIALPLLGLKFPGIPEIMEHLDISKTTLGLLGEGAVVASINQIRIAIENRNIVPPKRKK
jgi:hypothetical protein